MWVNSWLADQKVTDLMLVYDWYLAHLMFTCLTDRWTDWLTVLNNNLILEWSTDNCLSTWLLPISCLADWPSHDWLTDWLTDWWLTDWLTGDWLTDWLLNNNLILEWSTDNCLSTCRVLPISCLADWPSHDWLTDGPTDWLTDLLTGDWLVTDWLADWWLANWLTDDWLVIGWLLTNWLTGDWWLVTYWLLIDWLTGDWLTDW